MRKYGSADAAVTSAKSEITRSEADLLRAKQNFARQEQLNKEGLIAKDAYEKARGL